MSEVWRSMAEGMAFGRDWREKNVAEQKRNRLAELAQGVFQNDPRATAEAYSLDPNTAKAYTSGADRQHQIFKTLALQIKQAPTPDLRARIYSMYAPQLKQILPDAPDQWDESYLPMVDQVIAQAGYLDEGSGGKPAGIQEFDYLTKGLSPEEIASARKIKLGIDSRASSGLPYGFQVVKGEDGVERLVMVNKREGGAAQLSPGGMPVGYGYQSDAGQQAQGAPIRIDPNIPEHVRAMIAQNPEAFAQGGDFIGPPQMQGANPYQSRPAELQAGLNTQAQEMAKYGVDQQRAGFDVQQGAAVEAAKSQAGAEGKAAGEREATQQQRAANAQRAIMLLDDADRLIGTSTGSGIGTQADATAAFFGKTTKGAQSIAELQTIAGQLISMMPRMEGPQSDKDVQLYRQMAGDLANSTLPRETRMAAAKGLRRLQEKYAAKASAPNVIRYDSKGNRL